MNFQDSMYEVLQTSRYDFLTGRRVDIRETIFALIERVLLWLFDNFAFNMLSGVGSGNASLIATVFSVIAIVLVAIAAVVLIRAHVCSRVVVRHTFTDIFEEIKNCSVLEFLELSRTAKNRRVAVRFKYIAAILSLNEQDIILIKPSATNAIILRQIKSSVPELAAPFAQIADTFHLAWFGHKSLSDEAFDRFNSAVDRVIGYA